MSVSCCSLARLLVKFVTSGIVDMNYLEKEKDENGKQSDGEGW